MALARLVAEAAPSPALEARVLADAAMVAAERRPAPVRRGSEARTLLARLFDRRAYGFAGAAATLAVGIALGFGLLGESGAPDPLDPSLLSEFSPLDRLEREVMASLDEDLLDPDAPL